MLPGDCFKDLVPAGLLKKKIKVKDTSADIHRKEIKNRLKISAKVLKEMGCPFLTINLYDDFGGHMSRMRRKMVVISAACIGSLMIFAGMGSAEEKATPQEVYEKVLAAAQMIEQLGPEGLAALSDTKEFVWKDSYVWAVNCSEKKVAAHPNKKLIGLDLSKLYDKNPDASKRKLHNLEMCEGATNPNGVWVEYWWEKAGRRQGFPKNQFHDPGPGAALSGNGRDI